MTGIKKEIKVNSYAKVNLCLDVTGTREDGYHTVETVMQQVSLSDEIFLRWLPDKSGKLEILLTNSKPYLPSDERNIAYKAALLMADRCDGLSGKLKIHINKRIPVAAGLAGGSGNGAGVMIALNRIWEMGYDTKQLCGMGSVLGADVPFCILTQNSRYTCALGTGAGDILTPVSRGMKKYFLLAKPAFGVSTKDVFKGIDQCVITQRPDASSLTKALADRDDDNLYGNMINVLEEYTLKAYPEVAELKALISKTKNVRKVLMSGSGPTVIGVFDEYGAAKKACRMIRKWGYEAYWATAGKVFRGERHDKL